MKKELIYSLRDFIVAAVIAGAVIYGAYWLELHSESQTHSNLLFSYLVVGVSCIATLSAVGLALLFFLKKYFNRFITIFIFVFLIAANWAYVRTEHVSSFEEYFDSTLAPYSLMALVSLLSIFVGGIINGFKTKR